MAGRASVITDRSLVEKHYSPALKAWVGDLGDNVHDGSAKDPRIGIIRIKTDTITYAIVSKNILSRTMEVAQGAVTGKAAEVNNLREVSASDISQWRATHT